MSNARSSRVQWWVAVLWPSFLVAGAATIVFFTAFDPIEMISTGGELAVSRMGAYSLGFFVFWLFTALSSFLTLYFIRTPR